MKEKRRKAVFCIVLQNHQHQECHVIRKNTGDKHVYVHYMVGAYGLLYSASENRLVDMRLSCSVQVLN